MRFLILLCLTLGGLELAQALPAAQVRCVKQDCLKYGWNTYVTSQGRSTSTRCVGGDCAMNGWRTMDRGAYLDAICVGDGCFKDGWREIANTGYSNFYECNRAKRDRASERDCMMHGWTAMGPGSRESNTCISTDCKTNGWVTQFPNGFKARTICNVGYDEEQKKDVSDCFRYGWDLYN